MFKNPFRSSNTAKKNVMPPPVLPAGGPPAQKVGRPMILTPAQGNYRNVFYNCRVIYIHAQHYSRTTLVTLFQTWVALKKAVYVAEFVF